ncbi:MAG: metallophosphoesterase [Nitrososphaerota archaeon]
MRILQVSDIHGSRRGAAMVGKKAVSVGAELVLVVGDITNFGDVEEAESILSTIFSEAKIPVAFVPGNCDPPQLLNHNPKTENLINIHAKRRNILGYEFVGLGGSRHTPHRGTWIEFSEEELDEMLSSIKSEDLRNWVLVSHNPPSGVEASKAGSGVDLGSISIRRFVEHYKPMVVCCGHVHEARSISHLSGIPVVNAGPVKDGYCAVLELHEGHAHAQLDTL